jgi:acyl-CoA thioesterase-1
MASMTAPYGVIALRKNPGLMKLRQGGIWLKVLLALLLMVSPRPAAAAPVRLLVLGDSLSAGYGLPHNEGFEAQLEAALRAHGHDVTIIDGAVSGDTSAGGRARLDWTLGGGSSASVTSPGDKTLGDKTLGDTTRGNGADAAIVELGANDGLRGVDPAEMQANLVAILDDLAARHIPVLLSGMYAPPNFGPDYEAAFRGVFDRLGQRPGVLYDPFFLEGVATVSALNQADQMHPKAEGVRRIVARLLPLVEKLLAEVHQT